LNASITGLAVLPSKPIPPVGGSGSTGDKLFLLTDIMGGEYQVWSYPLPYTPLTCTALKQATISVSPKTATNELGPGKTHTVIATVNAGSGADIYDLWVNCSVEVEQANGSGKVLGFIGADGLFGFTYKAIQDPAGLYTDTITACFFNSETKVCDKATKTWVDTTPPTIVIISPQDGGKYTLNAVVTANYSVEDAVGVAWITASVPIGGPIPTSQMGNQVFTVTATDHGGNTATKSVTYQVLAPPVAQAGPDQTVLVGLPVALNGSGSHDPDGSIVAHAWNFGDGTSGTGVKPSHAYSSAGLKTVTLTVTDNDGLTGSDTLAVTVQTPLQGTQDLISKVVSSQLPQDIKDGLNDKLTAAINALNLGNKKAAINILKAFINMVNAQRGKAITNGQADSWLAKAQMIIDSIKAS
jgi:PKD repeat protein